MQFLLANFRGLLAGLIGLLANFAAVFALFSGGGVGLPFKANLGFAAFSAELEKVREAFVKGALMGGLVAEVEQEALAVFADAVISEDQPLESEGAIAEPLVTGHVGDEQAFGFGGGLVFVRRFSRSSAKSSSFSVGRMRNAPASPWRRLFKATAAFPAGVLGPVENCELARLAAARLLRADRGEAS